MLHPPFIESCLFPPSSLSSLLPLASVLLMPRKFYGDYGEPGKPAASGGGWGVGAGCMARSRQRVAGRGESRNGKASRRSIGGRTSAERGGQVEESGLKRERRQESAAAAVVVHGMLQWASKSRARDERRRERKGARGIVGCRCVVQVCYRHFGCTRAGARGWTRVGD